MCTSTVSVADDVAVAIEKRAVRSASGAERPLRARARLSPSSASALRPPMAARKDTLSGVDAGNNDNMQTTINGVLAGALNADDVQTASS